MKGYVVLRLLVLVVCWKCAWGAEEPPDEMLSLLEAGGATRAVVCIRPRDCHATGCDPARGCRAALFARYWLLARASCIERTGQPVNHALVLLHRDPDDCQAFHNKPHRAGALEALVRVVHPGYALAAAEEDWTGTLIRESLGPYDAALVLLATPAPPPRAGNHSAVQALLPELAAWLRHVPAGVPWAQETPPPREPARVDLARFRWLDSPMRVLVVTVVLPPALLLAIFALAMNWPLNSNAADAKETLIDCNVEIEDEGLI